MLTEERIIYAMLIVVGGLASASEVAEHGANIGTRATIALLIGCAGIVGMVRSWLQPSALPRARVFRRRAWRP